MDFLRGNRRNAVIPGEVAGVEREDVRDAVGEHQRGKASIVGLTAHDTMGFYYCAPVPRHVWRVGQYTEGSIYCRQACDGFIKSEAQAVHAGWPSRYHPELSQRLAAHTGLMSPGNQPVKRVAARLVFGIVALPVAEQDVAIGQDFHSPRSGSYRFSRRSDSSATSGPDTAISLSTFNAASRRLISSGGRRSSPGGGNKPDPRRNSTCSGAPTGKSTGSSGTITFPSKCARMAMTIGLYHSPADTSRQASKGADQ